MGKILIFDPLAWAATSNNNAATDNGQLHTDHVSNPLKYADGYLPSLDAGDGKAEINALINFLLEHGVNICESYHDWLKVGFALAEELGEEGRDAFHQLSAMSSKYNETECERKWKECLRSNTGRVRGCTLFWMAQQAGIDTTTL